jgi:long-chain acyl-CoA synthetase
MTNTTALRSFWDVAVTDSRRPAIVAGDGTQLTFGELAESANRLSRALARAGARPGDVVVGVTGNRPEFFEVYLACLQSGLYFVPTSPRGTPQDLAWVVEDCAPVAVVAVAAHAMVADAVERADLGGARAPVLYAMGEVPDGFTDLRAAATAEAARPLDEPVAGARVLYTGGTTGRPKGIRFPLPQVSPAEAAERMCALWADRLGLSGAQGPHVTSCPLYHGVGLMSSSVALHLGNTIVVMEHWTPEDWLTLTQQHRAASTAMVPTMVSRLLRLDEEVRAATDLSSLRVLIHSGAPCPPSLKWKLIDWLGDVVWEFYGASEAVGTAIGPAEWRARPGSVGRPLTGAHVVVTDDDGAALPPGTVGEVRIKGANGRATFTGAASVRKVHPAWPEHISAGDIGYLDDEGYLFLTDRVADIIVSGGVNVYSVRVESVLATHPDVVHAAVVGQPHPDWGESVVAVVQPKADAAQDTLRAALLTLAAQELPREARPKDVRFVEDMPLTRVGKIDKKTLKERYVSRMSEENGVAARVGGQASLLTAPDPEAPAGRIEALESVLAERWSCRGFRPDPVPRPVVERVLTAAQRTPSWSNVQPWQVSVVSGDALERLRRDMATATEPGGPDFPFPTEFDGVYKDRRRASGWALYDAVGVERGNRDQSKAQAMRNFAFFDAPHAAIITSERVLGTYGAIDCGLYLQTFLLAAHALGLGAIPQAALAGRGAFLRRWLGLPESRVVLFGVSFGYADPDHASATFRTDRASLEDAVTFVD